MCLRAPIHQLVLLSGRGMASWNFAFDFRKLNSSPCSARDALKVLPLDDMSTCICIWHKFKYMYLTYICNGFCSDVVHVHVDCRWESSTRGTIYGCAMVSLITGAWSSILISLLNPKNQNLTMSLRNDIMRFSVLGFRSDIRIELQAPVVWFALANIATCLCLSSRHSVCFEYCHVKLFGTVH